jgi:hypothetical protein
MTSNLKVIVTTILIALALCFGITLILKGYNVFAQQGNSVVVISPDQKGGEISSQWHVQDQAKKNAVRISMDSLKNELDKATLKMNAQKSIIDSLQVERLASKAPINVIKAFEATLTAYRQENDSLRSEIASRNALIQTLENRITEMANWQQYVQKEFRFAITEMTKAQGILTDVFSTLSQVNMFNKKARMTSAKEKLTEAKTILENLQKRLLMNNLFDEQIKGIDNAIQIAVDNGA